MPTGTYGPDRPDRAHGCNRRNRSYGHWRDGIYGSDRSDRPDWAHGYRHWCDGPHRADWTYGTHGADWSDGH